jgi:drug/metabolite transporter (DMT)-like permease
MTGIPLSSLIFHSGRGGFLWMSVQEQDSKHLHLQSILVALFVTVLWSSSWVIIKFGLEEIPPLTFAGLRYLMASSILIVFISARANLRTSLKGQTSRWWLRLILYGIVFITLTQGGQFLALSYLPSIHLSLLLNLTPIVVLFLSVPILRETPSAREFILVFLGLFGVILFFFPLDLLVVPIIGLAVGIGELLANSASSIMGRHINRDKSISEYVVTGISMTVGSVILVCIGILVEGYVILSPTAILMISWLAIVNTAIAFVLWHRSMQVLRAIDMTLINSTMMPQIVLLSILFLGEFPSPQQWVGLILLAASVFGVQWIQVRRRNSEVFDEKG